MLCLIFQTNALIQILFFLFYIAKYQFGQKSMLYKRSCAKTVCDKIHSADQRHMYNVHVANN